MSSKVRRAMDGNEAAAYASYAFTEVAAIYFGSLVKPLSA